jgi:hypothetical protein
MCLSSTHHMLSWVLSKHVCSEQFGLPLQGVTLLRHPLFWLPQVALLALLFGFRCDSPCSSSTASLQCRQKLPQAFGHSAWTAVKPLASSRNTATQTPITSWTLEVVVPDTRLSRRSRALSATAVQVPGTARCARTSNPTTIWCVADEHVCCVRSCVSNHWCWPYLPAPCPMLDWTAPAMARTCTVLAPQSVTSCTYGVAPRRLWSLVVRLCTSRRQRHCVRCIGAAVEVPRLVACHEHVHACRLWRQRRCQARRDAVLGEKSLMRTDGAVGACGTGGRREQQPRRWQCGAGAGVTAAAAGAGRKTR